jgi:hypothetical protein
MERREKKKSLQEEHDRLWEKRLPGIRRIVEEKERDLYPAKSNIRDYEIEFEQSRIEKKSLERELAVVQKKWAQSSPITQKKIQSLQNSMGDLYLRRNELRTLAKNEDRLLHEIKLRHEREDEEFYRDPEIIRIRELRQQICKLASIEDGDHVLENLSQNFFPRTY